MAVQPKKPAWQGLLYLLYHVYSKSPPNIENIFLFIVGLQGLYPNFKKTVDKSKITCYNDLR